MDLETHAQQLVELLSEKRVKLVLAESCTGGLVSAALTAIPGVSSWLAGSMVVYQEQSKVCWLGVDQETLAQ
ncbi:MAG: CinA family protein, partial [Planctomycetales bacterium]|nr:CinA family protein [Planctomycetales bacterium]